MKGRSRLKKVARKAPRTGKEIEVEVIETETSDPPERTANEEFLSEVEGSDWEVSSSLVPQEVQRELQQNEEEGDEGQDSDYSQFLPALTPAYPKGSSLKAPVSDPLTLYLREISRYPLLSPEQEQGLTRILQETGDIELAKKLVQANLRLVVKIAMEYRHASQNVMDLIQEGNIGLMKAVSRFDPSRGAKLSYYASWWIRSYILKFLLDNFRLVKIGTTSEQKKLFYNLFKERNRLLGQGVNPDTKTISENLGVSEKSVALMEVRMGPHGGEASLDAPTGGDEGSSHRTYGDDLASDTPDIAETLGQAQNLDILKKNLGDFLQKLGERDRAIFQRRLLSEVPDSLQSIADTYGVTRERIRQIEERLINKLRVYMSEFLR